MNKSNDLILKTTTTAIVFILLGFAIYLLFAGHNMPGGGFIGGLVTSGAIILLYMAYGEKVVSTLFKFNFRTLVPLGVLIALLTGVGSFFFGKPSLTHTFGHITLPVFGSLELATAMLFDIGVYLTVLGVTITIILNVNERESEDTSF